MGNFDFFRRYVSVESCFFVISIDFDGKMGPPAADAWRPLRKKEEVLIAFTAIG